MVRRRDAGDRTPELFADAIERAGPRAGRQISDQRYILPSDLPKALGGLADDELRALAGAVDAELRRRGKPTPPSAPPPRVVRKVPPNPSPLPQGRINAIRAALRAGVKPSQIARQFGVSQSAIRRVVADERD
jgi:hypothetical protein